jgi:hypothetical protein
MLTSEIVLAVWLVANCLWSFHNWTTHRDRVKAYRKATSLLDDATDIVQAAGAEQHHACCVECGRIVTRHTKLHGLTTCINCAADLARK